MFSKAALIGAFAALRAAAHGTVSGIVADGVYSEGWQLSYYYDIENGVSYPSTPGWYAEDLDNGFVSPSDYGTSDIICHLNAKNSNSTATVKAGGTVEFQWTTWPTSHIGPLLTYVANCGSGDDACSTVDKTTLEWVKIDEAGIDLDTQKWATAKLIANNNTWSTTVPSTLAAGSYVFRHEIIAMHGAESEDGAQNYPQCLNIKVTGSGTESPSGTLGTKLYSSTEAGILFNPYETLSNYTMPGPALWSGAKASQAKDTAGSDYLNDDNSSSGSSSSSSSSSGSSSGSSASASASVAVATPSAAPVASSSAAAVAAAAPSQSSSAVAPAAVPTQSSSVVAAAPSAVGSSAPMMSSGCSKSKKRHARDFAQQL